MYCSPSALLFTSEKIEAVISATNLIEVKLTRHHKKLAEQIRVFGRYVRIKQVVQNNKRVAMLDIFQVKSIVEVKSNKSSLQVMLMVQKSGLPMLMQLNTVDGRHPTPVDR